MNSKEVLISIGELLPLEGATLKSISDALKDGDLLSQIGIDDEESVSSAYNQIEDLISWYGEEAKVYFHISWSYYSGNMEQITGKSFNSYSEAVDFYYSLRVIPEKTVEIKPFEIVLLMMVGDDIIVEVEKYNF